MLMVYLFKVEVFDLGLNYSYSTDTVVIADAQEDRGGLLGKQFGDHNRSVAKRSVLLGARALTLAEGLRLQTSAGRTEHVWLMTRIRPLHQNQIGRALPRLSDEGSMYELLAQHPELYDTTPLWEDPQIAGVWFSRFGSVASMLPAAD